MSIVVDMFVCVQAKNFYELEKMLQFGKKLYNNKCRFQNKRTMIYTSILKDLVIRERWNNDKRQFIHLF